MPEFSAYSPGTPSWVDHGAKDITASNSFYTGLFDWKPETMSLGDVQYTVFHTNRPNAGMMAWQQSPPYWLLYLQVESCDQTAKQASALGGKVLAPPADIPNVGRYAVLQDPQGVHFGILEPLK